MIVQLVYKVLQRIIGDKQIQSRERIADSKIALARFIESIVIILGMSFRGSSPTLKMSYDVHGVIFRFK